MLFVVFFLFRIDNAVFLLIDMGMESWNGSVIVFLRVFCYVFLRAAFKFGRRVHLRSGVPARVPAILNGLTNRPS